MLCGWYGPVCRKVMTAAYRGFYGFIHLRAYCPGTVGSRVGHGLGPSMGWVGLGFEKVTHDQLWSDHLRNFCARIEHRTTSMFTCFSAV